MPVSAPSGSYTARTLRPCSRPRRAMSSASSSTETPALMRRTLLCESISLLKGMSWDLLRVIFEGEVFMGVLRDGPAGRHSLDLQSRRKTPSVLSLWPTALGIASKQEHRRSASEFSRRLA
jgi:hypothetical protein